MRSVVSVRGQTVIPSEIRARFGIVPGIQLDWAADDGVIIVRPIPRDPIQGLVGLWKGVGISTEDLLAERQADRAKDEAKYG